MRTPSLHLVPSAPSAWTTVAPNVQHTPAGGYRVRARVGKKRVTIGVFDTLGEALAHQAASLELVAKNESKGHPTLGGWMRTWLERRADTVRSIASERNRAEKHVMRHAIARVRLDDLDRSDVLAWIRDLDATPTDEEGRRVGWSRKKAGEAKAAGAKPKRAKRRATASGPRALLSAQTKKHLLKLVRGALAAAVDDGLIGENIAVGIKLRRESRTDDGSTVLTPDERKRLLAVVPEPERWIVAVALGTGLRLGEQWSLEIEDVHLDADVPYVEVRYGAAGRLPTKSGRPRRVFLVGAALDAMRVWMRQLATWCERVNLYAFPTQRGFHRGKKPPRGWKAWLAAAGITRRVRWHDLRHTCASALVSGQDGRQWTLAEVQAVLGHSSITTTERYAVFARDSLMAAAREANAIHAAKGASE